MEMKYCLACGMPLSPETTHQKTNKYCQYCADQEGKLKPREECQAGIAQWLKNMTPEDKESDYMQRADFYLKSMPAWQ